MCGIVGLVHGDPGRPVSPALIRCMCDAIRHRGPDDEGIHTDGPVGVGMRRLSIIDVEGGRQPIFSEDGSKVIVFNGEIYNYRDLRRDLIGRGHRFTTHGDTETILHLYEEIGPRCVERLRGMFALAIWDATTRSLFLARDRFGIKPLYYTLRPWGLAFASELKALVAAGLTMRELDWDALDGYFRLGYILAPATPFRDVRKLEPGHWLLWRDTGHVTVHPYWDLPQHTTVAPAHIEQRVLQWLDDSVTAHLVSDVPVAAFLSGGLDSSAVVASMALASNGDGMPQAFTAQYHGSDAAAADETVLARRLADRYGVPLNVVDITPDVRDTFEPIIRALDEPHADDSAIPTWALSQAVGQSHKVALTGIGGERLCSGDRRHLGLVAAAHYARLPRPLRRLAARTAQLLPDSVARGGLTIDRLKRFLRVGDEGTAERYLDIISRADDALRRPLYAAGVRDTIGGDSARDHFRRLKSDGPRRDPLTSALYFDYRTYLADDILALSDRLSMAHSLEIRVPFVDHALVEKVFPLPASVKVGRWEHKRLLRRALAERLPAGHFKAPKRGFVGPTAAWLRHELRPLLEDELSAARTRRHGYFDPTAVAKLSADHFSRRHNREGILWALLCFSTWHRVYVEPASAPPYQPARPSRLHAGALP